MGSVFGVVIANSSLHSCLESCSFKKMVQFSGTYKRESEEGYEDFLRKLNVGMLMRKAATASTPTMTISEDGAGNWKMVTSTTLKSIDLSFRLGEPFQETTTDKRECNTTVTSVGNTMTTHQVPIKAGEKEVKVIREFSDEGIYVQFICEDVVSKQFFKR